MKYLALFVVLPALLSQTARAEYIFDLAFQQEVTGSQGVFSLDGGDFNNDGLPDFAVACCMGKYSYLYIFLGNGNCTFTVADSRFTYPAGSITMNDFNNDGNLDLLIGEGWVEHYDPDLFYESDTIHVYEGNGDGTFTELNTLIDDNVWVTSGDLNNDGNIDIVISDKDRGGTDAVVVRIGNGDFTFQEAISYDIPNGILHTVQILGDMNLDGNVDIGSISHDEGITFLYGNGDGAFQPVEVIAEHFANLAFSFIGVGDFNEDGMPDIAATGAGPMSAHDEAFLWDGVGSFIYDKSCNLSNGGNWLELEDFNMDGHLDVAISSFNSGVVGSGYGNGQFSMNPCLLITGCATWGVLAEDFDFDGDQDLIFCGGRLVKSYRNTILSNGCAEESGSIISSELSVRVAPNPFSSSVTIEVSGNPDVDISIQVFDISGRLVVELELVTGQSVFFWDGKSSSGLEVPSGIYAARCRSGNTVSSEVVLKLE